LKNTPPLSSFADGGLTLAERGREREREREREIKGKKKKEK
jgi:hypothetical protein